MTPFRPCCAIRPRGMLPATRRMTAIHSTHTGADTVPRLETELELEVEVEAIAMAMMAVVEVAAATCA